MAGCLKEGGRCSGSMYTQQDGNCAVRGGEEVKRVVRLWPLTTKSGGLRIVPDLQEHNLGQVSGRWHAAVLLHAHHTNSGTFVSTNAGMIGQSYQWQH